MRKFSRLLIGLVLLALAAAIATTAYLHRREAQSIPDAQKLARTISILKTSTPDHKQVLKVLFYGQSITKSGWDKAVLDHWHTTYPNTVFVTQNLALGGFPSTDLLRATERDIAAFTPDLIVFHVYGNHHDYESIIRLFRTRTPADIIVQTDHGNTIPDAFCVEGLRHTLHRPEGCTGTLWLTQRDWFDEMSYHRIPSIAKKYNLAVEPQRAWWRNFLLRTHTDPHTLTLDGLHPNEQGKAIIANFFDEYFDSVVAQWNGQSEPNVYRVHHGDGSDIDNFKMTFDGTRLEAIASTPLTSWPTIAVDNTPTANTDGCYLVSRASTVQIVPDWPATRRITLNHDHTVEDWTATLTNISHDQSQFHFTLHGSVTGDDGEGDSTHDFTSRSGKISIAAQDWMPARAFALKYTTLTTPFTVTWSVTNLCDGKPEVIDMGDGKVEYRYTVVTGVPNTPHTIDWNRSLPFPGDDAIFRAYQPPLK